MSSEKPKVQIPVDLEDLQTPTVEGQSYDTKVVIRDHRRGKTNNYYQDKLTREILLLQNSTDNVIAISQFSSHST